MLASILLVTDQLESSDDPNVAQVAPIGDYGQPAGNRTVPEYAGLSDLNYPPPSPLKIEYAGGDRRAICNNRNPVHYSGPLTYLSQIG